MLTTRLDGLLSLMMITFSHLEGAISNLNVTKIKRGVRMGGVDLCHDLVLLLESCKNASILHYCHGESAHRMCARIVRARHIVNRPWEDTIFSR